MCTGGTKMYSNCLLEAIKAKIKDPKNVHIFLLPKEVNDCMHFMWKKGNYYYQSTIIGKRHCNLLLHPQKIKCTENYIFEGFVLKYLEFQNTETKEKIAKKIKMDFSKNISVWDWSLEQFNHDELPTIEDVQYFEKVVKAEAKFKVAKNGNVKIVNYSNLLAEKGNFEWKWIDLFDSDFERVYRGHEKTQLKEVH